VNKNNAVHAIVFEAVAVAILLDEPELMAMGVALLAKFLSVSGAGLEGNRGRSEALCLKMGGSVRRAGGPGGQVPVGGVWG
jgi:hypothetical protein